MEKLNPFDIWPREYAEAQIKPAPRRTVQSLIKYLGGHMARIALREGWSFDEASEGYADVLEKAVHKLETGGAVSLSEIAYMVRDRMNMYCAPFWSGYGDDRYGWTM